MHHHWTWQGPDIHRHGDPPGRYGRAGDVQRVEVGGPARSQAAPARSGTGRAFQGPNRAFQGPSQTDRADQLTDLHLVPCGGIGPQFTEGTGLLGCAGDAGPDAAGGAAVRTTAVRDAGPAPRALIARTSNR